MTNFSDFMQVLLELLFSKSSFKRNSLTFGFHSEKKKIIPNCVNQRGCYKTLKNRVKVEERKTERKEVKYQDGLCLLFF